MSKLEVDKIDPQSGTDLELGTSGDTITIPTGVTLDASNATTTLPANVVTTTGSQTLTNKLIDASQLTGTITPSDNTVSLAKLTATGTKDATTFLRGDNTFAEAGGGIEMAQQWRVTTGFTGSAVPIASNWEIVDTDGYGGIGSNMTESSGIFTFPSTGIYLINFYANFYINGDDRVSSVQIDTTTNNSTYSTASEGVLFIQQTSGTGTFNSASTQFMFDVTDTSTHKCRFNINTLNASTQILADSGYNATYATFVRLGDT